MEVMIQECWEKVLKVQTPIALDASFLSLGGDSHVAAQVASLCRQAGLPVRALDVLTHSTVRQLAGFVEAKQKLALSQLHIGTASTDAELASSAGRSWWDVKISQLQLPLDVETDQVECMLPCTPLQEQYFHSFLANPAPERCGMLVDCWELLRRSGGGTGSQEKPADAWRAAQAMQAFAGRHAILRTRFIAAADLGLDQTAQYYRRPEAVVQLVLRNSRCQQIDCAVVSIDTDDPAAILKNHVDIHAASQLYRTVPCTLSARILVTPQRRVYMSLVLWHILADNASTGLFRYDFDAFYSGRVPLDPAPGFDVYLRSLGLLAQDHGEKAVWEGTRYWAAYLRGARPCYILPEHLGIIRSLPETTRTRQTQEQEYSDPDGQPLTLVNNMGRVQVSLATGEAALSYCRNVETSLSVLLLFCWGLSLAVATRPGNGDYDNDGDVCFQYILSDRDRHAVAPQIDGVFGLVISYVYARVRVAPSARVAEVLRQLRDDDLAHRERGMLYRQADLERLLGLPVADEGNGAIRGRAGAPALTNSRLIDRRFEREPAGEEASTTTSMGYRWITSNCIYDTHLNISIRPRADGCSFNAVFDFRRSLFTAEGMQKLADLFGRVWEVIIHGEAQTVKDITDKVSPWS